MEFVQKLSAPDNMILLEANVDYEGPYDILTGQPVQDADTGEMIDILSPVVKHKITTTIQHKTEETGGFGSLEFQLVWNKQKMQYETVSVKQSQKSMFDDGYDYIEEEDNG